RALQQLAQVEADDRLVFGYEEADADAARLGPLWTPPGPRPGAFREDPGVWFGVVEGRERDHVGDPLRLAVEADAVRLQVGARCLDVLDAEDGRRAAGRRRLGLADADRDPLPRRPHFAPAHVVELVDQLEAQEVAVPRDRPLKAEDAHEDGRVAGAVD